MGDEEGLVAISTLNCCLRGQKFQDLGMFLTMCDIETIRCTILVSSFLFSYGYTDEERLSWHAARLVRHCNVLALERKSRIIKCGRPL